MWQDIGKEVSDLIYDFFDSGTLPIEINWTWMTLIPKVDGAAEIKDFLPISMIGCLYKIISNILEKWLSNVLPNLTVSLRQAKINFSRSSYRQWSSVVVEEKQAKSDFLKIDFQKAYDTIRLDFLKEILVGMGFGEIWTNWVMECVTTALMSILVTGSPTSPFQMQRGLRQGEPFADDTIIFSPALRTIRSRSDVLPWWPVSGLIMKNPNSLHWDAREIGLKRLWPLWDVVLLNYQLPT